MNFLKADLDDDFSSIGFKNQRKNLRRLPQTKVKRLDIERDAARKALAAGKRVSKKGNIYWETRQNRSDAKGKRI